MTYHTNCFDGHSHGQFNDTLDEAKARIDKCIDIPRMDICIMDEAGNTLAIRRWHKTPISDEQDPSACLDFGYYSHYGPWDDSSKTVAACAREDAESISRIMNNLRAGLRYGQYMANVRFQMYTRDLLLCADGQHIECNRAGSFAFKATPEKLRWCITRIFKMRPSTFEQQYDAYDPAHSDTRQRLNGITAA